MGNKNRVEAVVRFMNVRGGRALKIYIDPVEVGTKESTVSDIELHALSAVAETEVERERCRPKFSASWMAWEAKNS